MPFNVSLIVGTEAQTVDRNLAKLVQSLGIRCNIFHLKNEVFNLNDSIDAFSKDNYCIALSSKTINNIFQNHGQDHLENIFFNKVSHIFIYDLKPNDLSQEIFHHLTDGIISSVSSFENSNYQYNINEEHRRICNEFSGLSFGPINNKVDFKFDLCRDSTALQKIISIDGCPLFVSIKKSFSEIFFLATSSILDIDVKMDESADLKRYFSQLIPPMMFLKYVFGNKCWHNNNRYASLIIDDPLLRKRYGFLDYRIFLKCMNEYNFSSSIAFIPWNYRRTNKKIANLFKSQPQKLSICVHGCDHTKGEFGIRDENRLNAKIKSATAKMIAHEMATGVKFDNVMVFPQGIFSIESMKALKHNNYMAAVNTETFSSELSQTNDLKISDFLDIAIMHYEGFPLFVRHYPNDIFDFALMMFLGKPIFIVIHHDDLKDDYKNLTEFMKNLNTLRNDIRWSSVGDAIRSSYLLREESDEEIHVRVYANSVTICNPYELPKKLIITKYENGTVPIKSVSLNGTKVSHAIENNFLVLNTRITSKSSINMEIEYTDYNSAKYKDSESVITTFKTYVRRHLSEFRDNYVCKNDFLLKMSKKFLRS